MTDEITITYHAKEYLLCDPADLNGREIRAGQTISLTSRASSLTSRPVFQNAIALAEMDAKEKTAMVDNTDGRVRVSDDHFRKALKRRLDFKRYIDSANYEKSEHQRNQVAGTHVARAIWLLQASSYIPGHISTRIYT